MQEAVQRGHHEIAVPELLREICGAQTRTDTSCEANDKVPEPLNEVGVEQTEAETSEASKNAVAEGHDCQHLDIASEKVL